MHQGLRKVILSEIFRTHEMDHRKTKKRLFIFLKLSPKIVMQCRPAFIISRALSLHDFTERSHSIARNIATSKIYSVSNEEKIALQSI